MNKNEFLKYFCDHFEERTDVLLKQYEKSKLSFFKCFGIFSAEEQLILEIYDLVGQLSERQSYPCFSFFEENELLGKLGKINEKFSKMFSQSSYSTFKEDFHKFYLEYNANVKKLVSLIIGPSINLSDINLNYLINYKEYREVGLEPSQVHLLKPEQNLQAFLKTCPHTKNKPVNNYFFISCNDRLLVSQKSNDEALNEPFISKKILA